jgi:Flp pilus assembly protein TadB
VIRFIVNLVEKQNRNRTKKRSVKKLIAWVGLLFLVGAIWNVVSLNVWIVVFSGVAIIYILSHLNKAEAMKK